MACSRQKKKPVLEIRNTISSNFSLFTFFVISPNNSLVLWLKTCWTFCVLKHMPFVISYDLAERVKARKLTPL